MTDLAAERPEALQINGRQMVNQAASSTNSGAISRHFSRQIHIPFLHRFPISLFFFFFLQSQYARSEKMGAQASKRKSEDCTRFFANFESDQNKM